MWRNIGLGDVHIFTVCKIMNITHIGLAGYVISTIIWYTLSI